MITPGSRRGEYWFHLRIRPDHTTILCSSLAFSPSMESELHPHIFTPLAQCHIVRCETREKGKDGRIARGISRCAPIRMKRHEHHVAPLSHNRCPCTRCLPCFPFSQDCARYTG
eukprot:3600110-Rhodomonas_salina.2